MLKQLFPTIVAVAMAAAAVAAGVEVSPTLKVDLNAVVAAGVVQPVDRITSAGQPDEAALRVFSEQGYTTVIDLRTKGEDRGLDEAEVIADLGMEYVELPIAGVDAINFDNARALDELIKESKGPVLIHCGSGNRVGALLALRKSLEGADDATALAYGTEGGMTRLKGRVKDVLAESNSPH